MFGYLIKVYFVKAKIDFSFFTDFYFYLNDRHSTITAVSAKRLVDSNAFSHWNFEPYTPLVTIVLPDGVKILNTNFPFLSAFTDTFPSARFFFIFEIAVFKPLIFEYPCVESSEPPLDAVRVANTLSSSVFSTFHLPL